MSSSSEALVGDLFDRVGVASADLGRALAYQRKYGGRLEQILVNMGSLSADLLPEVYGAMLGAPVADARELQEWRPPEVATELPLRFLAERGWLPLTRHQDGRWTFLTSAPLDLDVNQWLAENRVDCSIRLVSADEFDTLKTRVLEVVDVASAAAGDGLSDVEETRLREMALEAPVVNLLNGLITRALRQRASDMHLEPLQGRARVRYRIDGVLQDVDAVAAAMVLPLVTRIKILAGMDIAEKRRPQDGKIAMRVAGEDVDIRVSTLPLGQAGESAVMRFLRRTSLVHELSALGLAPDVEARILEDLEVKSGVILLTGPTGSGKTTSLYTFLSRLNRPEVKIVTLEDPVEYQLKGVNQVQVQPDIGFDFARGLRSIVRQDPDVIMVGEIRDRETAAVAMQAALTGHLVFSTVHTNDAPSAYTRLLDLGVEEFLLNAALRAIVAQRLVRRLCTHCATPLSDGQAEGFQARFGLADLARRHALQAPRLMEATGCEACSQTGYSGRVAIVEYLRCGEELEGLPKDERFLPQARALMREAGSRSLLEDGLLKACRGETTVDEVLRVAG